MNFGFIHLYLEQDNHLYTWIKLIHTQIYIISHSHSTFGTIYCSRYIQPWDMTTLVQDDNVYRWVHGMLGFICTSSQDYGILVESWRIHEYLQNVFFFSIKYGINKWQSQFNNENTLYLVVWHSLPPPSQTLWSDP